jgi:group I intron endonuclease
MIIYKITNTINGKVYIGKTAREFLVRMDEHKRGMKKTKYPLYSAMRKHGWDNFKWEVLAETNNEENLNELEIKYVAQFNSLVTQHGYNLTLGGEGCLGYKHTEEALKKMRVKKGPKSLEARANLSKAATGIKYPNRKKVVHSEEHRKNVSSGLKIYFQKRREEKYANSNNKS